MWSKPWLKKKRWLTRGPRVHESTAARYDRLTTDGLKKIEQVAKRVGGYQRKLQYYRKRAEELAARQLQQATEAAEDVGRPNLRSVQV